MIKIFLNFLDNRRIIMEHFQTIEMKIIYKLFFNYELAEKGLHINWITNHFNQKRKTKSKRYIEIKAVQALPEPLKI